MLQKETINERTFKLLKLLQTDSNFDSFHLAGGTGLALQLGHRISVDLDLFSPIPFHVENTLIHLEEAFSFKMDAMAQNTLNGNIDGVKVDFITHSYPVLDNILNAEGVRVYSLSDIAAMKVNVITTNGTRSKDFVDLYFLLKQFTIRELLGFYQKKYLHRNSFQALKSLNYFNDVDLSDWPVLIIEKDLTWEIVKSIINEHCLQYLSEQ